MSEAAEVTIVGVDDRGETPGGGATAIVPAGGAVTYTVRELEEGTGGDLAGSIGVGEGKWRLRVTSRESVQALSLMTSASGHVTNLSTSTSAPPVRMVPLATQVEIPPDVDAVDVTVAALGAESIEVAAGGKSSVLIASDADGTLMLAAANEDGGYLGESPGAVDLGIESTAITLVAVASGRRFGEIDRELADTIRSHHEFGRLTGLLASVMGSDKNYLDQLYNYPQAVTLIKSIAAGVASVGTQSSSATGPGGKLSQEGNRASLALSEGDPSAFNSETGQITPFFKEDFYCVPGSEDSLGLIPCSPWNDGEPWNWFGDAAGVEAFWPDNTLEWALTIVNPFFGLGKEYAELLWQATGSLPFPAVAQQTVSGCHSGDRSCGDNGRHATANPNFVNYAMELYEKDAYQDWFYTPGNSTMTDKLLNSGAAYREFRTGPKRTDEVRLSPEIDRLRFQRYRFSLAEGDEPGFVDRGAVVSFMNTLHLIIAAVNVITDVTELREVLKRVAYLADQSDPILACSGEVLNALKRADSVAIVNGKLVLNADPETSIPDLLLEALVDVAPEFLAGLQTKACTNILTAAVKGGVEGHVLKEARSVVDDLLGVGTRQVSKASVDAALFWVKLGFDLVNDAIPVGLAYFRPAGDGIDYFLYWSENSNGTPFISHVSMSRPPQAAFNYTKLDGFKVELDASPTVPGDSDDLKFSWRANGADIGQGERLVHNFGSAGRYEVELVVLDGNGLPGLFSSGIEVIHGRKPVVSNLECTSSDYLTFRMVAEFSDADGDIRIVEWRSNVGSRDPDLITSADTMQVELRPAGVWTWASVSVVDAGGNRATRVCSVNLEQVGLERIYIESESAQCRRDEPWRACYHRVQANPGEPVGVSLVMPWEPTGTWRVSWCMKEERQGLCDGGYDWITQIDKRSASVSPTPLTFPMTPPAGAETFWVVAEVRECSKVLCRWPADFTEREFHHIEVTVPSTDRQALEALYDATGGSGWRRSTNWKTAAPLDQWYGVRADTGGRVIELNLDQNRLRGTVPVDVGILGNLTNLESLNISRNELTGTLPLSLTNLQRLRTFRFDGNDGLCAPATPVFSDWLQRIKGTVEGPACASSSTLGMEFKWIPSGEFRMGSTSDRDEQPVTQVQISRGFWLGKYEVTQGLWQAAMGSNPSHFDNCGSDCPVESVAWEDVQAFILKLNQMERGQGTGYKYRLPTEAEWEYAARAGTSGLRYVPGLDLSTAAWYARNSGNRTHPVGQKNPNSWGLYDMLGNVGEWVHDWHGPYPGGSVVDPTGPGAGSDRVVRGCGFATSFRDCRSAFRIWTSPEKRFPDVGFRLVRTLSPPDRQALEALYDATGGPSWTNSRNWKTEAPLDQWYGVSTDVSGRVIELNLDNNGLSGTIPSELGKLTNLLTLYVSRNRLTGELTSSLTNLQRLRTFWFHENDGLCAPATSAFDNWVRGLATATGLSCAANRPPQAVGSISDLAVSTGTERRVSVRQYFRDPDGDRLTYHSSSSNTSIVSTRESGSTILFIPVAVGKARVTITARDPGGLTALQTMDVTVSLNRPPQTVGKLPNVTVPMGAERRVPLGPYFRDPDGDELIYKASSGNNGVLRATVPSDADFVVLSPVAVGTARVTITAQDPDGLTVRQTMNVTVFLNRPPQVAERFEDVTLFAGQNRYLIDLRPFFSDPDGDALNYDLTSSNKDIVGTYERLGYGHLLRRAVGTVTVTVTARDPHGLEVKQTFRVTVTNDPPDPDPPKPDPPKPDPPKPDPPKPDPPKPDPPTMTDRQALEALYDSTNGPGWEYNSNWKTSAPLHEWVGVQTNAAGRVFWLSLVDNDLSGTIPASLGNLRKLEELDLQNNNLSGSIPASLGNLRKLEKLSLGSNNLSGMIPASLGNLTTLRGFWADNNNLSGPIPAELGRTRLRVFVVNHNNLSGTIPASLGNLSVLLGLYLHNNNLSGTIPASLGDLSELEELRLAENKLRGTIPASLGNLSSLKILTLQNNQLSGMLPSTLTKLRLVLELLFGGNAGLCAPSTRAFQDWLSGIRRVEGPTCSP